MPVRFSQVAPNLFRGGFPTQAQLADLYRRGVRTVISLHDDPKAIAEESAMATRIGIHFVSMPFSEFHEPPTSLLHKIVDLMRHASDGNGVYVHCHAGRDRTSLVVALYRVWVDGWTPAHAWQHDARAFGHTGWTRLVFYKLDRCFRHLTQPSAS